MLNEATTGEETNLTWVSDGEGANSVELTTSCAKIYIVYSADQAQQSVSDRASSHACQA